MPAGRHQELMGKRGRNYILHVLLCFFLWLCGDGNERYLTKCMSAGEARALIYSSRN